MRIIAGQYKGRRLASPTWPGLRPTSDRLRETLFNVLAPRMPGARLLDGFAGTGAVGIEALSRGARDVVFVERDPRAIALIERNLVQCHGAGGYTIRRGDVASVLRGDGADGAFDVIFLDPPYDAPGTRDLLAACAARVRADGVVILEHATRRPPDVPGSVTRVRDLRAGDSTLTFYTPITDPQGPAEPR